MGRFIFEHFKSFIVYFIVLIPPVPHIPAYSVIIIIGLYQKKKESAFVGRKIAIRRIRQLRSCRDRLAFFNFR